MSHHGKTALAREKSRIVMGPWEHGVSRATGDLDFGPEAKIDRDALELHWYDYWLKGMDNGLQNEPAVTLFVMGKNMPRGHPNDTSTAAIGFGGGAPPAYVEITYCWAWAGARAAPPANSKPITIRTRNMLPPPRSLTARPPSAAQSLAETPSTASQ